MPNLSLGNLLAEQTIPKSRPVALASFDSQLGRDGAMLTDSWLCNRLKQKETLESLDQRGRTHLQPLLWSSKNAKSQTSFSVSLLHNHIQ